MKDQSGKHKHWVSSYVNKIKKQANIQPPFMKETIASIMKKSALSPSKHNFKPTQQKVRKVRDKS
jgi:uncharacterized protein YxjI